MELSAICITSYGQSTIPVKFWASTAQTLDTFMMTCIHSLSHTQIYIFVDFLPTLVCLDDYCDAVMAWMQTSLRELTTLGIKNAENLAIPSVRNDVILLVLAITLEISSRVHCRVWVPDKRTSPKAQFISLALVICWIEIVVCGAGSFSIHSSGNHEFACCHCRSASWGTSLHSSDKLSSYFAWGPVHGHPFSLHKMSLSPSAHRFSANSRSFWMVTCIKDHVQANPLKWTHDVHPKLSLRRRCTDMLYLIPRICRILVLHQAPTH